ISISPAKLFVRERLRGLAAVRYGSRLAARTVGKTGRKATTVRRDELRAGQSVRLHRQEEMTGDVVGEIAAGSQYFLVVELVVDTAVDTTASRFLSRGPEAGVGTANAGRSFRVDAKADSIGAEEASQCCRGGAAEGAVAGRIGRERRRRQQRIPV